MSPLVREAQSGDGSRGMSELHGHTGASDQTRMANACEPSTEPSWR